MSVIIKAKGMGISREMESSLFQTLLKGPMKISKHPVTFNIEISGGISKNHFGEVLVAGSNLEKPIYGNRPNIKAVGKN